ncbi:MAG: outer membrane lipoprotein carrier protein LolA [Proteobacteria bacterium]|nr:outer membrane lipoprotein carrier protein LolA [Pseudomonadota bacterium]
MDISRTCKLLFLTSLAWFSLSAYSNNEEIKQQFKKLNELANFEVAFQQTKMLKDLNFTIKSSGNLKVSKPSNIVWKVTQPSYLEVNIDPDTVTIVSKEMDGTTQKQIYKYDKRPKNAEGYSSLLNLMSLLSMNIEQLVKEYDIVEKSKKKFLFTPKLKSDVFKNILVQLGNDNLIKRVDLQESSGDTINIIFQGYKINQ